MSSLEMKNNLMNLELFEVTKLNNKLEVEQTVCKSFKTILLYISELEKLKCSRLGLTKLNFEKSPDDISRTCYMDLRFWSEIVC